MPPERTQPTDPEQTAREIRDHIPPPVLIRADGSRMPLLPANGERFTLEELQAAVGGYIEPIYLGDDLVMLVDEDGKLRRKNKNELCTWLAQPGLWLFEDDYVVGDALILPAHLMD